MTHTFLIKQPWITERAVSLHSAGKYVFVVKPEATKNEIKKAIKELYRVDAVAVNIVTKPSRIKRFRGVPYVKQGIKKAIVTLKKGQSIDLGV